MTERKPYVFDPEACWEGYYQIFPEDRPKEPPKPKPKVAKVVSITKPPIEAARKATLRSVEQLAEREKEEAARAKREAQRIEDEERRREWMVAQRQAAIDACWARQIAEREIGRAWDPQGLYGPATLASPLD